VTHRGRSLALGWFAGGVALIGVAYGSAWLPGGAPHWGIWAMILGAAVSLGATLCLGALGSNARRGWIVATAVFLVITVAAGFGAPLLLAAERPGGPLVLGLPLRAAIEIYGVGLLPMAVLPFVFAREFDTDALDAEALARFRDECARLRAADEHEPPAT
jgi:hypothetical protein